MLRRRGSSWFVNSSREHLRRELTAFARRTRPGMRVLDAGAGRSPYRPLFAHAAYEAADFAQLPGRQYAQLDYVCDLTDIPVEDGRFDRVLLNQVLEHLPEPAAALRELRRVLAPGGVLFCSAPLFYPEHQQPYDFYRYTQYGLRKLFEEAGYTKIRIRWLEGYFGTVGFQFEQMRRQLPRDTSSFPRDRRGLQLRVLLWATRLFAGAAAGAFARADLHWKHTASGHPKNYVVVARRPRADG